MGVVKVKSVIIPLMFGLLVGAVLVSFLTPDPGPPEIVEIVKHETRWITPPATDCEKAPIVIEAVMADDAMEITAGDGCKTASASVRLECPAPSVNVTSHAVAFGGGALAALVLVLLL
jgi:hypothetical protein